MKFKELSAKSTAELQKELATMQAHAVNLRVKNKLGQIKNTHELRQVRKDIARVLTALTLNSY